MFSESNFMLLIVIGCINLGTFIIFYVDKRRAIKRKYRISEKTLLMSSFLFGGIGGWLGMIVFRHKTQHALFKYTLPVAAILTVGTVYLLISQDVRSFFY